MEKPEGWCEDCVYYEPDLASYESAKKGLGGPRGVCAFGRHVGWPKWIEVHTVSPRQYRDCGSFWPKGEVNGAEEEG